MNIYNKVIQEVPVHMKFNIHHISGLTLQESSTETSDTSLIPSSRAQTQNPSSKSMADTGTSNPKPTALSSKKSARCKISESQSSSKLSKPSDKTKSTSKKGSGTFVIFDIPRLNFMNLGF
jgi:hypothetical protein